MKVIKEFQHISLISTEYFKYLSNGIWEIRAKVGRNAFRILCFFDDNLIIATNGFKKKTQKTPNYEIKLAEQRKNSYFIKKEGNKNG